MSFRWKSGLSRLRRPPRRMRFQTAWTKKSAWRRKHVRPSRRLRVRSRHVISRRLSHHAWKTSAALRRLMRKGKRSGLASIRRPEAPTSLWEMALRQARQSPGATSERGTEPAEKNQGAFQCKKARVFLSVGQRKQVHRSPENQ